TSGRAWRTRGVFTPSPALRGVRGRTRGVRGRTRGVRVRTVRLGNGPRPVDHNGLAVRRVLLDQAKGRLGDFLRIDQAPAGIHASERGHGLVEWFAGALRDVARAAPDEIRRDVSRADRVDRDPGS